MKIRDLFNYVHKLKEDPFEDSELLMWLNEVEGLVHTKVFLLAPSEYKEITADDIDSDTFKLLIVGPHQKIYPAYLVAMIDFANGEYNRYANTLEMFNAHFTELQMWHRQYTAPADGECEFRGYYLSAYAIAVKHGFSGSEDEWLDSLKGDKGDSAYDIAVKLGYKGTEQEWIAYLEKAQTDAIDAALESALKELSDQSSAGQGLINSARDEALQIIGDANSALSSNLDAYHSGMEDHYQYISAELNSVLDNSINEIEESKSDAIDEIGSAVGIVQTTGNGENVVMSQKASSNAFANALKGTASGEAIAISDASPIEHEMGVKVSGVSDISTVKVKKYGKNLYSHGSTFTHTKNTAMSAEVSEGKTYTASAVLTADEGFLGRIRWKYTLDGAEAYTQDSIFINSGKSSSTLTVPSGATNVSVFFQIGAGTVERNWSNIQVEVGNTATEYEPYIEPAEYSVSADGTVKGVTSFYPNTTLITDTAGAVIDCTYNRDINKAFEELYNAIISTGGNV